MKITLLFLTLLLIRVENAHACEGVSISPDRMEKIVWECSDINKCKIYILDRKGSRLWLDKEIEFHEPKVRWLSKELAEIRISCGAPCWYCFYYSRKYGLSSPFQFVIAVNSRRKVVAVVKNQYIYFYSMFKSKDEPFSEYKMDYPDKTLFITAIKKAYFDRDGNLRIYYFSYDCNVTIRKTIKIKYPEPYKAVRWSERYSVAT